MDPSQPDPENVEDTSLCMKNIRCLVFAGQYAVYSPRSILRNFTTIRPRVRSFCASGDPDAGSILPYSTSALKISNCGKQKRRSACGVSLPWPADPPGDMNSKTIYNSDDLHVQVQRALKKQQNSVPTVLGNEVSKQVCKAMNKKILIAEGINEEPRCEKASLRKGLVASS